MSAESFEATDGEEITNEIPDIRGKARAMPPLQQMCLIHRDFKHFAPAKAINFARLRKVSSIMRAKVLSIMRPEGRPLRRD